MLISPAIQAGMVRELEEMPMSMREVVQVEDMVVVVGDVNLGCSLHMPTTLFTPQQKWAVVEETLQVEKVAEEEV